MNANTPIILIGGASGVGKSSLAYPLADRLGLRLVEMDDFQRVVEHITDPAAYPEFHFWRTHPEEALAMSDEEHLDFFRRYAARMCDVLALVVASHLDNRSPMILEGDFILPELILRESYDGIPADRQVTGLILAEADEAQIGRNYRLREGREQPDHPADVERPAPAGGARERRQRQADQQQPERPQAGRLDYWRIRIGRERAPEHAACQREKRLHRRDEDREFEGAAREPGHPSLMGRGSCPSGGSAESGCLLTSD